jgi:hypothetical protein
MKESIAESLNAIPSLVKVEQPSTLLSAIANSQVHVNLVHSFVSLQSLRAGGSVYAFTSTRKGEGVTHVVELLGNKLGPYTGAKVLVVNFGELAGLSTFEIKHFEERWHEQVPGVWSISRSLGERSIVVSAKVEEEVWSALRSKFQYILIDCPALDTGSQVLSIGHQVDGIVLVVCAGFGHKQEIQQAARLLNFGSGRLLGCILNRRTYAIPARLFKLL